MEQEEQPLAQVMALEELKRRYRVFDSRILTRWAQTVTGIHRDAMLAILAERETEASVKERVTGFPAPLQGI